MRFERNTALTENARSLRKNSTPEERQLWYRFLRTAPGRFRRQQIIGSYIVDFYSDAWKLVIELDGSQHFDDAGIAEDRRRDQWLRAQGLTVVRYTNTEIKENFSGVCEDILRILAASSAGASEPSP